MKTSQPAAGEAGHPDFPFTSEAGPAHRPSTAGQRPMVRAIAAAAMAVGATPAMASVVYCAPGQYTIPTGVTHPSTCIVNNGQTLVVQSGGAIAAGFGIGAMVTYGVTNAGAITNSGTITGSSGVVVVPTGTVGGLINTGSIGGSLLGVSVGGAITGGILNNGGTISGAADGIKLGDLFSSGASVGGGIVNTNGGTISGGSGSGIVVVRQSTVSGGIRNDVGSVISGGANGVSVSGALVADGITNAGTISGATNGLVVTSSGTVTGGITNSGSIRAATAGILVSGGSTVTGGITNSGTIYGGTSAFSIDGTSNVPVVLNQAGGLIDGLVTIEAAGTSVTNAGTIAMPAGTVSTIAGNYTQLAAGVLRTRVLNDTTYGQLSVGGTVTLPSNAKIDVDVTTPGHNFTATGLGNVISAGTLVSDGTFSVTDNSVLFDFTAVKDGNTVDLVIAAASPSGVYDAAAANHNSPAFGAARTLDGIIASDPSGPIAQLFTGLTTRTQVSNAATQSMPLLTGNSLQSTGIVGGVVAGTIQNRLGGGASMPTGDMFLGDGRFWIKPFGSRADQGERQGVAGFKANVTGLATGFDVATAGPTRLGVAFAYAGVGVDSKSSVAPHHMDTDVYQFVGYGSHSLDATTELGFQIDAGRNRNRGARTITFAPSVAHSSFDSTIFHVGANLSRSYAPTSDTTVIPSVRIDYTTLRDEAYTETGAGVLNLNVDGRRVDQLIAGGDVRFVYRLSDRTMLSANIGAGYDVLAERSAIVASFAGAPGAAFTTYGADPTPWVGRAGLGATYRTNAGMEVTARYDAEARTDFLNQTASLRLRWMF